MDLLTWVSPVVGLGMLVLGIATQRRAINQKTWDQFTQTIEQRLKACQEEGARLKEDNTKLETRIAILEEQLHAVRNQNMKLLMKLAEVEDS